MIIRLIISGRVQGVFFRANTKEVADKLGIKGYVRNTGDSCVEVIAIGDEDDVKEFIEFCKKGPSIARVDDVKIDHPDSVEEFNGFEIR